MPTVREFARLTTDDVSPSLDQVTIMQSAFDWLAEHASNASRGAALVSLESPRSLKVANYVGVIDTPCGTRLEILPKYAVGEEEIGEARRLLVRMVSEALHLKPRVGLMSDIEAFDLPLPEWLALRFLDEASRLIKRGLRQSYYRVEDRGPFLRGALDVQTQIRSGPGGAHLLAHRHDVYSFDRPENRLIRTAVEHILRSTRSSDNWRLARELSMVLGDVPKSRSIAADLRAWSSDRLMADYAAIKPLCELVLLRQTPFAISGNDQGFSMLFPMERLFEQYVMASLRKAAPFGMNIRSQVSDHHLCRHLETGWFGLKPDILVSIDERAWVVDAKWKLLSTDAKNYQLSQADFYQLFAYGHAYLGGEGDMFLVYPRTAAFQRALPPFHFSSALRLHVLPFDLFERTAPFPFLAVEQLVGERGAARRQCTSRQTHWRLPPSRG